MLDIAFCGACDGRVCGIPDLLNSWLACCFRSCDGALWVAITCSLPSGAELQAVHVVWLRGWIYPPGGAKAERHRDSRDSNLFHGRRCVFRLRQGGTREPSNVKVTCWRFIFVTLGDSSDFSETIIPG